jgi:acyl-CoA dehydrogenase
MKLQGAPLLQRATELAVDALGYDALADQGPALYGGAHRIGPDEALTTVAKYLNTRAASIYGGTNETQKNILARTALGL